MINLLFAGFSTCRQLKLHLEDAVTEYITGKQIVRTEKILDHVYKIRVYSQQYHRSQVINRTVKSTKLKSEWLQHCSFLSEMKVFHTELDSICGGS